MSRVVVSASDFRTRMASMLEKAGIPQQDALIVADSLVEAEVQGRESHGLMRFPALYSRISNGKVTKKPDIKIKNLGTNLYAVDGDNALGAVLAERVMEFCTEKAKENGLAVAAVKNANHLGAAGYYTNRAANDGMFAFLASNAGPAVAPTGGMTKLLGTSPFAVSFPAGKYGNFLLDIATSASAMGKIMMYAKEGKSIPLGWAMDKNGADTTDAQVAVDAYKSGVGIMPMAAHKGMGMSMIIDVLAGLLSGAKFSYQVSDMFNTGNVSGVGYFIVVLDIKRFMPQDEFEKRIEEWFDLLKNDRPRPHSAGVFIPGEIEHERQKAAGDNLDVFAGTIEEIEKIEKTLK